MKLHPLFDRVLCVALVASVMIPLGRMIFPHVNDVLGGVEFNAIAAVASATIGFAIYAVMFG
jgi:hypothetical protein